MNSELYSLYFQFLGPKPIKPQQNATQIHRSRRITDHKTPTDLAMWQSLTERERYINIG